MKIDSIKCDKCEEIHQLSASTFFTVAGNIYIGTNGGVVGNNLHENTTKDLLVVNMSHYCKSCLFMILKQYSL